jgi:hypothetical protein
MRFVEVIMTTDGDDATIILVTPVWNDSKRLASYGAELARELARRSSTIRWVIADDGSGPEEARLLNEQLAEYREIYPHVTLHLAAEHHGKGSVVREAWSLFPDADWLSFADADGSVNAPDMLDLIADAVRSGESTIGVRKATETTRVEEGFMRGVRHRGFLLAVHLLLGFRTEDAQCGAKVIRGDHFRAVAPRLIEPGWAFDAEMLAELYAAGFTWRERPVNWVEKGASRIRPWLDSVNMLLSLIQIRRRLE